MADIDEVVSQVTAVVLKTHATLNRRFSVERSGEAVRLFYVLRDFLRDGSGSGHMLFNLKGNAGTQFS